MGEGGFDKSYKAERKEFYDWFEKQGWKLNEQQHIEFKKLIVKYVDKRNENLLLSIAELNVHMSRCRRARQERANQINKAKQNAENSKTLATS